MITDARILPLLILAFAVLTSSPSSAQPRDLSEGAMETSMTLVSEVLSKKNDPRFTWVNAVSDRVVKVAGVGSATLVHMNSEGQGVVFSAQHILGPRRLTPGRDQPAEIGFQEEDNFRVWSGSKPGPDEDENRPWPNVGHTLVAPGFPANTVEDFPPSSDYIIAVITGRKVPVNFIPDDHELETPDPTPLEPVRDPLNLLAQKRKIASPVNGQLALAIGFPKINQGQKTFSLGRVLTGSEAKEFFSANGGPTETDVPFDERIEFLILAKAASGMSGGGAFDQHGRYLGILIRAGVSARGTDYIRVLRADWVAAQAKMEFERSGPGIREQLRFIEDVSDRR